MNKVLLIFVYFRYIYYLSKIYLYKLLAKKILIYSYTVGIFWGFFPQNNIIYIYITLDKFI
jgi:hypothetical protein